MSQPPARRTAFELEAIATSASYRELIERLRRRIRESQTRAARALNTELVMLYWSIGREILAQQRASDWGRRRRPPARPGPRRPTPPRTAASPAAISSSCVASPRSGPIARKCRRCLHKSGGRITSCCSTASATSSTCTPGTWRSPQRSAGRCATLRPDRPQAPRSTTSRSSCSNSAPASRRERATGRCRRALLATASELDELLQRTVDALMYFLHGPARRARPCGVLLDDVSSVSVSFSGCVRSGALRRTACATKSCSDSRLWRASPRYPLCALPRRSPAMRTPTQKRGRTSAR
jgi:hypothetical protein